MKSERKEKDRIRNGVFVFFLFWFFCRRAGGGGGGGGGGGETERDRERERDDDDDEDEDEVLARTNQSELTFEATIIWPVWRRWLRNENTYGARSAHYFENTNRPRLSCVY